MADNLRKAPKKGILKSSSSFEKTEPYRWDIVLVSSMSPGGFTSMHATVKGMRTQSKNGGIHSTAESEMLFLNLFPTVDYAISQWYDTLENSYHVPALTSNVWIIALCLATNQFLHIFELLSMVAQEASINQKEMKWDEMNILQTLHPPDKDYGHMKIDEPKTPYSHFKEPGEEGPTENADPHSDSDDERDGIDPKQLAMQIKLGSSQLPKAMIVDDDDDDDDDDEEDEYANETEEQRAKRKLFEKRRREHYNEFFAVKLARKLREEEEEEDEDEDENAKGDSLTSDSHVSDEQNHDHMDHQAVSTSLSSESPNSRDTAHLDGD